MTGKDVDDDIAPAADAVSKPVRPKFRKLRFAVRAFLIILAIPIVFALVASVTLVGREVTAPSWLQARLESTAAEILSGGTLKFGQIKLVISDDLHPRVRMRNVVLRDAQSTVIARVPSADVLISPRGLVLKHEVLVQEVVLRSTQIGLRRRSDGSVALAFDASAEPAGEAASFIELVDQADALLAHPLLEALETVRAEGVIVNYADARAGRSWTLDGGSALLDMRGEVASLRASAFLLSGRSYATRVDINVDSPKSGRAASMGFTVVDGMAADLASQSPALGWLSVLDAPITASLRGSIDDDGNLGPLFASISVENGAIQPSPDTNPIPIGAAKTYLTYDPKGQAVRFTRVEAETGWGAFTASGQAYLRGADADGWPQVFESQFTVNNLSFNPGETYDEPLTFERASADFRLSLEPFRIDVGNYALTVQGQNVHGRGQVRTGPDGWEVDADLMGDDVDPMPLLSYWPETFKPNNKRWFTENLRQATLHDMVVAMRFHAGKKPEISTSGSFSDAVFTPMPFLPVIEDATGFSTLYDHSMTLRLDKGTMRAPQGGDVDVAGSEFTILDTRERVPNAHMELFTESTVTAALSVIDLPPMQFLTKANQPVTMADGRARVKTILDMPLMPNVPPELVRYSTDAVITNMRSTHFVPDHTVTAGRVDVHVDNTVLRASGDARVGDAPMSVTWSRQLGPDAPRRSRLDAEVTLTRESLAEFNIALPDDAVSGEARGRLGIDLIDNEAPRFTLETNMEGARVAIAGIDWVKPASSTGNLSISGVLSNPARIESIDMTAPGLEASGFLTLGAGGLQSAEFSRVRVGNWLNAPVTITPRGAGQAPAIALKGGSLDLRSARFGGSGDGGGPISAFLDTLVISDSIRVDNLRGVFDTNGGLRGTLEGDVNGEAPIVAQIRPSANGIALEMNAQNGGEVLSAAGLMRNASGGNMNLWLESGPDEGVYDGTFEITDLRVQEAPALAALLDAASIIGLLTQLDGQGLLFTNVDGEFRLTPDNFILGSLSAVGPGLGISLDGVYTLATGAMDFQGVVSPIYLINGLGSFLTRRGEGLIGFNYNLGGTKDDMTIMVNPLSMFTPGMFREIFRRPPPDLSE
ncbi:DUF3971 domain-containing protein [Marivivens aquimaris]|uniref:DUF3971 domain-containing protein n=1 Tax=Marivivens aquimaris TaxID=2774876 RepID=UPI001882C239|nr:DUF3971 domain-containing protein [Marivivens aquimaris]